MGRTSVHHRPRQAVGFLLSTLIALGTLAASPQIVAAVDYNDTNPAATPCGDGSHEVFPIRSFYIKGGSLIYARIELRWSQYCNTVWTKVVNLTGSGSGYASERSLTSEEQIVTYDCPNSTLCFDQSQRETGDVLPGLGSSGWSHQLVLPPNGLRGSPGAKQPPTIRGLATIRSGTSTYTFDTLLEPLWTWYANNFKNERNLRTNTTVMTCTNDPDRCVTHGEPNFASAIIEYELHPSLGSTPGSADLPSDIRDVLLPAWSQRMTRSPKLVSCVSPCSEEVLVMVAAAGDADLGGNYAVTVRHGFSSGTPALFLDQTIKIKNQAYDHPCGASDDGCYGVTGNDDRILISHEIGHTLGLGHCDLNYGVMCHTRPSPTSEITPGTAYWKPQKRELLALQAFYP